MASSSGIFEFLDCVTFVYRFISSLDLDRRGVRTLVRAGRSGLGLAFAYMLPRAFGSFHFRVQIRRNLFVSLAVARLG
jgi:hypothetical protein